MSPTDAGGVPRQEFYELLEDLAHGTTTYEAVISACRSGAIKVGIDCPLLSMISEIETRVQSMSKLMQRTGRRVLWSGPPAAQRVV